MEKTVSQIESHIKRRGRGKLYLLSDFAQFGSDGAARITLMRLVKSGMLIRVAQGIYAYPVIDTKLGLGIVPPSMDKIAKLIALRDKARIIPTGAYALYALGLSTQIPVNIVYLTDGAPRKIKVYNHIIRFIHTTPKNLAYKSEIVMMVVSALKEIGYQNVSEEDFKKIKSVLAREKQERIAADIKLAPAWIRNMINSINAEIQ